MSNDFSRWAPPEADPTPAPGSEPKTQSTAEQSTGRAAGDSGVASSLKPVLGSLVTGATRTTATPRSSASPREASSPASAPRKGLRPPRRKRDPQRLAHKALYRRLLNKKVITGAALAVIVLVLALPKLMTNAPSFSSISSGPIAAQGYKGSATNTNVLSSDWAAGVSTAWVLADPRSGIEKSSETTLFVDDTTLYMVSRGDKSRSVSIAAIDVSSSEPTVLWTSNDESMRLAYSGSDFSIVSAWQWIAVENILISKSTGIQTKAPWEDDHPVAMVDDILVTCSGHETCSGWTYSSGSWARLWQSITGIQSRTASVAKWDGTRVIGTGEEASVLVPVDNDRNPQIVNAHTGVVSTLGKEGRLDDYNHPVLYPASDGILVDKDSKTFEKFDTSGKSLGTVKRHLMHIIPAEDGRMPTVSEWEAFYDSGRTPWTTAMLEATGDGCESLTVRTTGGIAKYSADGMVGISASTRPPCTFSPEHARASADGTAAFIQKNGYKSQVIYFFDMANNKAHTSAKLSAAQNLTWVFDDLLVGLTDEGLIAFTPTSS